VQQRLTLSRQIFYCGLALMLGAGVLSATVVTGDGAIVMLVVLTGAGLALIGRLWHQWLLRSARRMGRSLGPICSPLDVPGESGFTS